MKYTVIMTPTAKSDIVNLKSSLEQQIIDSSFIRKELKLIYQKISSLAIFPERYPIVNSNTNYRKLSYKKYLILYKVINNNIYIFYIRPSKMNILQEIQKHIKKSALADFFNALLRVYVVVRQIHHLHLWYLEFVLKHVHRFALVPMLYQQRQRSWHFQIEHLQCV